MRQKVEEILKQLKFRAIEINGKFSKKAKIVTAIILVVVLVFAFIAAAALNNKKYTTLFTGLTEQEATEITAKLQESEVDFKIQDGSILVLEKEEAQLMATLVSQGYPKSGLNYGMFKDNVDLMSTDYEKNSYKIFDLQERLAAVIRHFDGVKDSTVTIAVGSDKKYALEKEKVESSASVVVIMEAGGSPSAEQVKGIQRLVAKSIPDMKMENVAVIDGDGREVSSDAEADSQLGSARLKLSLEKEIEDSTRAKILHLLGPIYGEDNVRVAVKSTVDVDKKIREITNYLPTTEDNKGVMSKEVTNQEAIGDGTAVGGTPGTESNANIPIYPGVTTDGKQIYFKDEKALDYLVSQVKEQIQSDSGVITDLTVSVAVDSDDLNNRKIAELKQFVAVTAGIDPDPLTIDQKVAVFNSKFYSGQEDTSGSWNGIAEFFTKSKYGKWVIFGGIGLLLLLIIAAILILIMKKRRNKEEILEEQDMLDDGIMSINVEDIKNTRETELREQIRDFADSNPEISAQLIKTWLKGGDQDA